MISVDTQPFSMIGNAVGHMMVGLAPRLPQGTLPSIEINFGSKEQVRSFRSAAYQLFQTAKNEVLYSDFAHTTTQGTALEHQSQTAEIIEADIHYFAACSGSEEMAYPLEYQNDFVANCYEKRFAVVLNQDLDLKTALMSIAKSVLLLCRNIPAGDLRLHSYADADGSLHPGMSEYGLVVLEARKANTLVAIEEKLKDAPLESHVLRDEFGKILSLAFFGSIDESKLMTKKDIKLWNQVYQNSEEKNASTICHGS